MRARPRKPRGLRPAPLDPSGPKEPSRSPRGQRGSNMELNKPMGLSVRDMRWPCPGEREKPIWLRL